MPVLPAEAARVDAELPVVVVGAGACGLCAALAATEAGAETLVLERDAVPAGSTALSTGLIPAAGTALQAALGIDDTPELFAADILAKARGQTDAAMALAVARASGPAVAWLMERHDVVLSLVEGFLYPGHSRLRMHGTPHRSGRELQSALLAAVARRGIDILAGARVADLYAEPDGRVRAVGVVRPDGARETVGCRALVLACNGFGGDRDMLRRHIPEIAEADYAGHAGNTGDAVRWGAALGAALADMGAYQGHGAVAHPHGNTMTWGLITGGGFQVNASGERFSNEAAGYSEQAVEVVRQPGRLAWTIFDAAREAPVLGFTDYQEVLALGGIRKADTIEGLAQALGLPEAALARTLAEVEALRAEGGTDRFGRRFSGTAPLTPPFCGVRVTGALYHTQGGLVVDPGARVLRSGGDALPNLFAGGGAARGLSGPSRWGYLSGNGLLTATVLGRAAGIGAARLAMGSA
jgi:fumarate reductase flavoprotein subunit